MNWEDPKTIYSAAALGLILARYIFEFCLDRLNTSHVQEHANQIPESFREIMGP